MRPAIPRTAALAVALLAIAACGTQRHAAPVTNSGATPPVAGQNGPPAFVARARQVTAQWDRSAVARVWRTGLVVMGGPSSLTQMTGNGGFSSERQKEAFASGSFRMAAALPDTPPPGLVRWADGSTLRPPLLSARAAFGELARRPCANPGECATFTGAQPGTVTIQTSRGPASVPAWTFTVAGVAWKVSEVAVARSAMDLPTWYGGTDEPAGMSAIARAGLIAVAADGRTLTISLTGTACDTAWGGYRYETATTVVVGSWDKLRNLNCMSGAILRTARVTLTRPLGTRVILDVLSGGPLIIWS